MANHGSWYLNVTQFCFQQSNASWKLNFYGASPSPNKGTAEAARKSGDSWICPKYIENVSSRQGKN